MKVSNMLKEMEDRALGDAFFRGIRRHYEKEILQESHSDPNESYNYNHTALLEHLTPELTALFHEAEALYEKRCAYAASFSFKQGLFGGFRQYFGGSPEKDAGYNELVFNDLMMQPRMQLHHENFKDITRCNEIQAVIQATYPPFPSTDEELENYEHNSCTKVFCLLEDCVEDAAVHGFYCGYRAAYNLIESAHPGAKQMCIDLFLTTEYRLGYIGTYQEMERRLNNDV